MKQSHASVETESASKYLQQRCKHFSHKLPVEFTPEQGKIEFSIGACRLAAKDRVLNLAAEAADEAALTQLRGVVDRHLLRFAFREEVRIDWHPD